MSFPILPCRVAVLALALFMGAPSRAAEPLTLAEAQRLAVSHSLQLVAQDALALAAREQGAASSRLPDPVLRLGIDNLPVTGPDRGSLGRDSMTMRRIGLSQELPRLDKRQRRAERFEREAEQALAVGEGLRATVQQDATLAWLDSYYTQAMQEVLAQRLETSQRQVQAADSAFRTGRGAQADVFAARSSLLDLQQQASQLAQRLRGASLTLARWVGAEAAGRTPAGSLPPWHTLPAQADDSRAFVLQHPELLAMAAEIDVAQLDVRLAEAAQRPDWSVEASYSQRGPGFSSMVSLGVSVPLQWDAKNRQNRELAGQLARVDAARARHEDRLRSRQAEVQGLRNDWQAGLARLVRHDDALLPAARQRAEAALTGYRTGKGDLTSVLAAQQTELEVRMQALTLALDTARIWAQLRFLAPEPRTALAETFKE